MATPALDVHPDPIQLAEHVGEGTGRAPSGTIIASSGIVTGSPKQYDALTAIASYHNAQSAATPTDVATTLGIIVSLRISVPFAVQNGAVKAPTRVAGRGA
jgi:hypothetical protein